MATWISLYLDVLISEDWSCLTLIKLFCLVSLNKMQTTINRSLERRGENTMCWINLLCTLNQLPLYQLQAGSVFSFKPVMENNSWAIVQSDKIILQDEIKSLELIMWLILKFLNTWQNYKAKQEAHFAFCVFLLTFIKSAMNGGLVIYSHSALNKLVKWEALRRLVYLVCTQTTSSFVALKCISTTSK